MHTIFHPIERWLHMTQVSDVLYGGLEYSGAPTILSMDFF